MSTAQMNRAKFIGGSDAAAILGVSPWKSPFMLYQEKIGEHKEEITPDKQKIFDRGHRWEPVVIDMLLDELKDRGHEVRVIDRNGRFVDLEHNFLAAEIDLELLVDGETVNGEMKTVHPFAAKDWGEQDTDEIPLYYTSQVLHGQMVTRRNKTIVAALIGADDLRVHVVDRDEEMIQIIRQKEIEFWQMVKDKKPPEPVSMEDLKLIYSHDDGKAIEADDELLNNIATLKDLKERAREGDKAIEYLSLKVRLAIRSASHVLYQKNELCTWKKNRDGKDVDWKEAFKNLADLIHAGDADPEKIDAAIDINTKKVIGSRVLRLK